MDGIPGEVDEVAAAPADEGGGGDEVGGVGVAGAEGGDEALEFVGGQEGVARGAGFVERDFAADVVLEPAPAAPGDAQQVFDDDLPVAQGARVEGAARAAGFDGGDQGGIGDALARLGDRTYDLYLNDSTCWLNVPSNVYGYVIGGYQVIKKWLSYRQADVLGRSLSAGEALEVVHMVRRIAAILLLQPVLNANYRAVKETAYSWPDMPEVE